MFSKLFNRAKAVPAKPTAPVPAPTGPNRIAVVPQESRLKAFREDWDARSEASHEVIEGNGGNTDWGVWTDAVEEEEKSFAPTVSMPLIPK